MKIKEINVKELLRYKDKEGLILKGCGGELKEWVDGINGEFTDNGILLDGTKFKEDDCVTFNFDNYTCLMFGFNENTKLDMGKLALWRLATINRFGGEWLTDFVDNKLGGFEEVVEPIKPKCPLIGQDGNIHNLIGIASRTLRQNQMQDKATEMSSRIYTEALDYSHALRIIGEYVEITSIDDEEMGEEYDEDFEEGLYDDYDENNYEGMDMIDG